MRVIEGVSGCACCYNTTEGKFVDLVSAYDGPVLENGMTIDDLILCEACVKKAGEVLGANADRDAITQVKNELVESEKVVLELRGYIAHLEDALSAKPVVELPKVEKTGRKKAAA